jgi:hypothetical protein
MELASTLAPGLDQTRDLEQVDVLRDRLTGGSELVLCRQT